MNNKCYYCPFCQQNSSRKWNLQVHLIRKHRGLGSPLQKNRDEWSNGALNKYSSKRIFPFTEGQENLSYLSPVGCFLKNLRELIEIENFFDGIAPRGGPHSLHMPMCESNSIPTFEEHISGYERYICRRCLATSPLSFIVMKDTGEVFRTEHRCHPVAIARVQKLTEDEKNCMFLHQNKSSIDTMQKAIKGWWTGGKSPFLIAKKLQSVPRNSYDFTSEIEQGCEWLNRVIREDIILLDDEQLQKFLFLSNGNSYVTFYIIQGELQVRQSYFITLSKEPSFPFDFIPENPEIPPFNPPQNVWLSLDQTLIYPEKENLKSTFI